MTLLTLVLRSLRFHARSHLGALLGAAVGTAVLVGALVVGDSVRASLRRMALARLGNVHYALAANDRFFRAALANDLSRADKVSVVPVLQVQATAAAAGGAARANQVQVLGVDEQFWKLASAPVPLAELHDDDVILNRQLAAQLNVKVGDDILLRVNNPSRLSREAALAPQENFALALRVKVRGLAGEEALGRFSLMASQIPPFNAFVSLSWLSRSLQLPDRANVLLVGAGPGLTEGVLAHSLAEQWQLPDAGLELRPLPGGVGLEVRSSRVFLDPASASAALRASSNAVGVLTYFVNELRAGERATPYSMVTATGAPIVPAEMKDDEILVNSWLADDLQVKAGDSLGLRYFQISGAHRLEERTNSFKVRAVLPMSGAVADPALMPDFPGLEKADSTRDWDSTLPISLERIRPKDEEYWKQFRGTPKAFVTLAAGQKMWSNRFGDLTAVRYLGGNGAADLTQTILHSLNPGALGLIFQPVRTQALAASEQAQDFGQLFLGFSFFLVVAALLLMALLFQFGLEKRTTEIGTLLALGFTPRLVRKLLLWEGAGLACVGSLLGVLGGTLYAKAMLYGLSTLWRSAVGTSELGYDAQPLTLVTGVLAGILVAVLTLWFALRKQARQPAYALLGQGEVEPAVATAKRNRGIWIGWLASAGAMLLIGGAGLQQQTANPEIFFLGGTLLLISGLGFTAAFLAALAVTDATTRPTLSGLGLRSATRRRRRSLATVGLLACGSFLIASIGAFRLDTNNVLPTRSGGTGGFALIGESTFPIVQDLNTAAGRQALGLSDTDLTGVRAVPLRVHDGEDASCLNLNRAQRPRLLGVRPEQLSERHAFTITQVASGLEKTNPWLLLDQGGADGSVPAIADAASIEWALGKKVGDLLPYTDETGRQFNLRLVAAVANSILQGNLLISEREFLAHFPSESGYRMFLLDVQPYTPANVAAVASTLTRAAQDYGMQLTSASSRLASFNAVQNTYLNTFQVLGGLGLLLGSIGLGVVVLRNVLERRGELALFQAVGFPTRAIQWLVLSEHGALLLLGLLIGILSAFVAVLPSLFSPHAQLPVRSLCWTLGAVFCSGALWTWLATRLAFRGSLLDALRNE